MTLVIALDAVARTELRASCGSSLGWRGLAASERLLPCWTAKALDRSGPLEPARVEAGLKAAQGADVTQRLLYSYSEAAQLLGSVSVGTVARLVRDGRLPAVAVR